MGNGTEVETRDLVLNEITVEFVRTPGRPHEWTQLFLRRGARTEPTVAGSGMRKVVCLKIGNRHLTMQCLNCLRLFVVGGCPRCGHNRMRIVAGLEKDSPVEERRFACDRCGHITPSGWCCPGCGTVNPNHLTAGILS